MNHSTEKMLMDEIPRIRELLEHLTSGTPKLPNSTVDVSKDLKPGVRMTKNGKFFIPGKGFIKKEDAYA